MSESYTLADFGIPGWLGRAEYRDREAIHIDHIRSLHPDFKEHIFGKDRDNVAFERVEQFGFEIWLYNIAMWSVGTESFWVVPSFLIIGTTFDGVREVQACAEISPSPMTIIEQMQYIVKLCDERKWGSKKPATD